MDVKLGSPFLLVQECDHFFNLVSRLHVQGLGVHPGSVILLAVPKNVLGESLLEESFFEYLNIGGKSNRIAGIYEINKSGNIPLLKWTKKITFQIEQHPMTRYLR